MLELDLQRRKQLIRDLSHELKTPIAVVKGYSDGLKYGIADDTDTKEKYCRDIKQKAGKLFTTILVKINQTTPDGNQYNSGKFPIIIKK